MPRKKEVGAPQVLEYFESVSLETATLVLELARSAIRRRQGKPAAPVAGGGDGAVMVAGAKKGKGRGPRKGLVGASTATTAQAPPVGTPLPGMAPIGGEGGV